MKKMFVVVALAMLSASCSTIHSSQINGGVNAVANANLKADVTVGEKITGQSSLTMLFGFFALGTPDKFADGIDYNASGGQSGFLNFDPNSQVKSAAAYNAVSKSGADIIIAPKYVLEETSYLIFKTVNATVTGYKGSIKSIK